ncbi:MAG: extracellular solute-binding protein [Sediminibacterium sp.]|nr:MAG: extracellular solute-binding protein [Sediminibacterium sp.]
MIKFKGITWDHARGYDPLIAASELYFKQKGIQVEWQKRSLTNFGDQSLEELSKQFDLIIMDHPHVGVAEASNCFLPLNDLVPANILNEIKNTSAGPSFESYHYHGKQWALPIDAAMQCASYRADLMSNESLPTSWEEVFALAKILSSKNLYIGMALCPTDCLCSFLSLTAQLGSPIKENNKVLNRETLNNELLVQPSIGLKALSMLRTMRDVFHPKALDWNPIALYDYMADQNDIAYSPLAFCYTNYSRIGFRKNILKYHTAPELINVVLGGAGIAITSSCCNVQEAAYYAAWICSDVVQSTIYVNAQGQPGNKMAWENKQANVITNNFFTNTMPSLTNAYLRPRYQGWPRFQTFLGETIHAYLVNDTDPALVLEKLQAAYADSYLIEKNKENK